MSDHPDWLMREQRNTPSAEESLALIRIQMVQIASQAEEAKRVAQELRDKLAHAEQCATILTEWKEEHDKASHDLMDAAPDLLEIREAVRWSKMTRKVLLWIIGAILGGIALWGSLHNAYSDLMGAKP